MIGKNPLLNGLQTPQGISLLGAPNFYSLDKLFVKLLTQTWVGPGQKSAILLPTTAKSYSWSLPKIWIEGEFTKASCSEWRGSGSHSTLESPQSCASYFLLPTTFSDNISISLYEPSVPEIGDWWSCLLHHKYLVLLLYSLLNII